MALTGEPSIIFLDEPSSGLDPVKRRELWSLIKKVVKNRSVLLTTHLMEEADTLCDSIGIITKGVLRCHGESINLKRKYIRFSALSDLVEKAISVSLNETKFVLSIEYFLADDLLSRPLSSLCFV